MIQFVVFDIGDVVCRFEPHRRLAALSMHTGLEPERIHEAIWSSGLDARADRGDISPAELERAILSALENRIDAETLRAAWSRAFVPDAAVCDLIGRLELPAFAFTNNGPMLTACFAHELAGVGALFRRVICSWEVRACKPDPVAYDGLCRELECLPQHLLFVDDKPANTAAARAVGLDVITFVSVEQLSSDLADY